MSWRLRGGLPRPGRVCATHEVAPLPSQARTYTHYLLSATRSPLPPTPAPGHCGTVGSCLVLLGVTELGSEWEAGKTWQNSLPFLGHPGGLPTT